MDLSARSARRTSQHGEDGIVRAIFEAIGVRHRVCVDVGAYDLITLSNTNELWQHQGWRAILIEGNSDAFARMVRQRDPHYDVVLINEFVRWRSPGTLDELLAPHNVPPDFDFLSIDIDGNDYHVWKSLSLHRPRVITIEYNPTIPPAIDLLGKEDNYLGASALALLRLGQAKGYSLVACTSTNLFFVLAEYATSFAQADDLEALFDYSNLCYVMTSYDGGMFFSNTRVPYPFNYFSDEVRGKIGGEQRFFVPSTSVRFFVQQWVRDRFRRRRRRARGTS